MTVPSGGVTSIAIYLLVPSAFAALSELSVQAIQLGRATADADP